MKHKELIGFKPINARDRNEKLGNIPYTTSSAETCPSACPLKAKGCYAKQGPLYWHWRKVTEGKRGITWQAFLDNIKALPDGQVWRHNQAGDLPGVDNDIDTHKLDEIVKANTGKRGFTYTHKPVSSAKNRKAIARANHLGFTINLSADNLREADTLKALNITPVAVVLPLGTEKKISTPAGNTVILCPAQYKENLTCGNCKLCAIRDRKVIIGFEAHGASKKHVSNLVGE